MMDFGPHPESNKTHKLGFKLKKDVFLYFLGALIVVGLGLFFILQNQNPLPTNIRSQISYKAVYPTSKTGSINQNSYQYQTSQQALTFTVKSNNHEINFTEQPAPSSLGTGSQVYFPAIGLHPYAQFQSKLGPVALIKFYQSGSLKSAGESAILVSDGTMTIIHSDNNLSNEQWKDIVNSLKITK